MQFTEPAELEDIVGLLRFWRMQEIATDELSSGTRLATGLRDHVQGKNTLFGRDPTVARLFASSPPANTYTVEEDDLREEYDQPVFIASRDAHPAQPGRRNQDSAGAKKQESRPVEFAAAPVPVGTGKAPPGILSQTLESHSKHTRDVEQQDTGPRQDLSIFLPDQTEVRLRVPVQSNVQDAIRLTLEHDKRSAEPKLVQDPAKYELRIHDDDGLPDMDFPALDGGMQISNFFEGDSAEFCLCSIGGEDPAAPGGAGSAAEAGEARPSRTELAERAYAEKRGRGIVIVKIYLPENGSYVTVNVTPGMQAIKLLSTIQTKHRLPLFTEEYQFILPEEERVRLGRSSSIVQMKEDLFEAAIRDLELRRKSYADAPSIAIAPGEGEDTFYRERGNSAAIHHEDHVSISRRPPRMYCDPDNFLFNDQTAALYEEWNVIKTNKWGKRQRRVFGIDYQKIYNRKQQKDIGKTMLSHKDVKRAERLIADVVKFEISKDDPCCVEIWWKDLGASNNHAEVSLKYEVENAESAAYIVAKMKYIISNKRS